MFLAVEAWGKAEEAGRAAMCEVLVAPCPGVVLEASLLGWAFSSFEWSRSTMRVRMAQEKSSANPGDEGRGPEAQYSPDASPLGGSHDPTSHSKDLYTFLKLQQSMVAPALVCSLDPRLTPSSVSCPWSPGSPSG